MTANPTQSDDALHYDGHDLEALFELRNYQRWIASRFAPYVSGRAVEFGAGMGAFSQWLTPLAREIDLVEPSPNLVDALGRRFGDQPHVTVVAQSLEAYLDAAPSGTLDTAVMVNLLEHIEDDCAALRNVRRALRPRGHLLIFVPAMPALYSQLDRLLGHYRRYRRRGLSEITRAAGLEIVSLRYFDILGIAPWWLVNTIGGKTAFDPFMSRLYDMVGVPTTRLIEAVVPPPIGKNLLMIARNPG